MPSRTSVAHFDLRQVRAFLSVANELHFGRAAGTLFMTQPALSRTIRHLEDAIGAPLFERTTRRVRLTAAGEAFAAECRLALGHLDLAAHAARNAAAGREGNLRVAYMDFAINGRLPAILQSFRTAYPGVSITLEYMPTAAQQMALLEGRVDIGFMIGPFEVQKAKSVLVDEQDYVALLPESHPLARRETLRLPDLAGEPFVMFPRQPGLVFHDIVMEFCLRAGFRPRVAQEANQTHTVVGLVSASVGVALVPASTQRIGLPGVAYRPLRGAAPRSRTALAWRRSDSSPVVAAFLDVARRVAKQVNSATHT